MADGDQRRRIKSSVLEIRNYDDVRRKVGTARYGVIQAYFRKKELGEKNQLVKLFDIGDFIGVEGSLVKTKTGEVTVFVREFDFLSKSLNPLFEKYHKITDVETRYRQRYLVYA